MLPVQHRVARSVAVASHEHVAVILNDTDAIGALVFVSTRHSRQQRKLVLPTILVELDFPGGQIAGSLVKLCEALTVRGVSNKVAVDVTEALNFGTLCSCSLEYLVRDLTHHVVGIEVALNACNVLIADRNHCIGYSYQEWAVLYVVRRAVIRRISQSDSGPRIGLGSESRTELSSGKGVSSSRGASARPPESNSAFRFGRGRSV